MMAFLTLHETYQEICSPTANSGGESVFLYFTNTIFIYKKTPKKTLMQIFNTE